MSARTGTIRLAALVILLAIVPASLPAQDGSDPVEAALLAPPADGMLVMGISEGSQAVELGIRPGDVIVSYAGQPTPDLEHLRAAMTEAAGRETATCTVKLLRAGGQEETLELKPGPIGVSLMPIRKGHPTPPLPPDTGVTFDLSSLADHPRELWLAFALEGETKVGFEHAALSVADGVLRQRHEVAFDGGEQWGLNHQLVELEVQVGESLVPLATRYTNALNGWRGETRFQLLDDRPVTLQVTWPGEKEGERTSREATVPTDLPVIPSYLVSVLAGYMPRKEGACFRFRSLAEGMGEIGLPAALVVVREEEIEVAGQKRQAWRVEQRRLGGQVATTTWVDADGETLQVDYGGARAWAATREEALADLPEGLQPRTADPGK